MDSRFLATPPDTLRVNDILAACNGNCSYTFTELLNITKLDRNDTNVSINLSNPTNESSNYNETTGWCRE